MYNHVRYLGWLHIALGSLGLGGALLVWLIGGSVVTLMHLANGAAGFPGTIVGFVMGAVGILIVILSLPAVIAGWGLLNMKPWARVLTLILSAFNLFHVPFGTALAVYAFWALLKPETDALFRSAHATA